jgi:CDP-2,3-bis-(O-geranylgeranyl)-sn-glycerol synthase
MDALGYALALILYILPSYFANSTPVLLGGGAPIDGGRRLGDGQRVLGDGKTVRGFFTGVSAGVLAGAVEGLLLPGTSCDIYGAGLPAYVLAGLLLGLGTMVGDLAGSFVKRRQKLAQGKPSLLLDQLTFLIFAIAFSYPLAAHFLTLPGIIFLLVLTYFVHVGANVLANRLGLKKVPW